MKIYLSYKFSGKDKEKLRNELEKISDFFEKNNHQTYIFYRDVNKWGKIKISPDKILEKAFSEIEKSDMIFVFHNQIEKSEGMLLELGYAKALNKKVILAIQKDIPKFYFTKSISDVIMEFNNTEDLIEKLKKYVRKRNNF